MNTRTTPPPAAAATTGPTKGPAAGPASVTVQASPQVADAWGRMRRRVDGVRSHTGRVATVAGTGAAAAVVAAPAMLPVALAATAATTLAGVGILRLQMPHAGHQKATATVLYAAPGVSLAVLLIAERIAAGAAWGGTVPMQVLALTVWAAGTWLLRPARVARRMASPPPPPATVVQVDHVAHAHPAARWWAERVAADGGPAAGTALEAIELSGDTAMTAIIAATTPGDPVPEISIRRLSALLDTPEDQISITAVPGRGAGVRRLTVGTPDRRDVDPVTVWAEKIAPLAMPGAVLTGIRVGKPGAVRLDKAPDQEPDQEPDQGPDQGPEPDEEGV
ncbi:hypothetical protein [Actinomadura sp. 3N407]|uniref:hypothetical protein n=1 Tax=Actinomadura sp. 3N407 TaxID=3457423 RepID=UPI003FCDE6D2